MSTITRERVKDILEFGAGRIISPITDYEIRELARIALASLEAEAVAWIIEGGKGDTPCHLSSRKEYAEAYPDRKVTPLYTAPPAPAAMKDHQIRELVNELRDIAVEYHGTEQLRERIARTIRAAMLQGGDGNSPVIPDWQTQAEKMAELYGSSFVLFRNGESPQCADPTKVIISFTDDGLGHGSAAPQQEVKS
ncbi:hypothetical protein ACM4TQ_000691 [Escherichia coli]|jgi:hypothetical protein|uniref:hypothetical protein n=1 Tax=Escherichia coli TaxID=562 RepID=UPI00203AD982|nr:hypothetical protein [Escherichia coli]DAQ51168.1 MAG TPA: hypothetical protein [Caudoviricetes sp.]